jgi:hypothetical protein
LASFSSKFHAKINWVLAILQVNNNKIKIKNILAYLLKIGIDFFKI